MQQLPPPSTPAPDDAPTPHATPRPPASPRLAPQYPAPRAAPSALTLRTNPQFNKGALQEQLPRDHGLQYEWLGKELGGARGRKRTRAREGGAKAARSCCVLKVDQVPCQRCV